MRTSIWGNSLRDPLALALLVLFSPAIGGEKTTPDLTNYKLTTDGLGPLRVGMSYAEFAKLGLRHDKPDLMSTDFCTYVSINGIEGVGIYLTKDAGNEFRLSTVDVQNPAIKTASGAHVGNALAELKRTYAAKLSTQRIDWPDGDSGHPDKIWIVHSDSGRAMAFYPDHGNRNRIGMIYAGSNTIYIDCF